ncbi:MAG: hypothetical protein KKE02_17450 [Alphaproteobacteria bacterium]|nr:hypothetical protein [Alphaproteobacteria bacterium]MBU1515045.1 hypothetical protein [Alphaproteobacteria bacterium]MBU2095694.1 hypothetical protein [Alphaproteobacteria bacterium]MBU2152811.1 hypothetical protein [Alphaproteobacteria bacterium]MBU2306865.1 hypothetical protein [Alphaproteobacteria bacterium]
MLTALHFIADGLWIVAMALIASTSQGALKRVPADAKMPMQWGKDGKPTWRLSRNVALGWMFGLPLVVGLGLSALSRLAVHDAQSAVILFLMRTLLAALFAVVCLTWLRGSLRTLEDEGVVIP